MNDMIEPEKYERRLDTTFGARARARARSVTVPRISNRTRVLINQDAHLHAYVRPPCASIMPRTNLISNYSRPHVLPLRPHVCIYACRSTNFGVCSIKRIDET